jgi:hypothetical protein
MTIAPTPLVNRWSCKSRHYARKRRRKRDEKNKEKKRNWRKGDKGTK